VNLAAQIRTNLVLVGWLLLGAATPMCLFAISRSPNLNGASIELGFYIWGLCFMTFGGLACAALGTGAGLKRILLTIASLVTIYLWISYVGMEVMRR
jgi:hypothetical protein